MVCAFVVDGLLVTARLFFVGMFGECLLFFGGAAAFIAIVGLVCGFLCLYPIGVLASMLRGFLWLL